MVLWPTHLSLHDASQLLAFRIAIVSGQIGAQSHGHLVARLAATCRIAIVFQTEVAVAVAVAGAGDGVADVVIVEFACTMAITGACISNASWKEAINKQRVIAS